MSISNKTARRKQIAEAFINEARRQYWIKYHFARGEYAQAQALGWVPLQNLTHPQMMDQTSSRVKFMAACKIQARQKSKQQRREYVWMLNEKARTEWIDYYLKLGDFDSASDLGW